MIERPFVLVIEDDADDQALMVDILRKLKLANRAKYILDGAEASRYLTDHVSEASELITVFLDLTLPLVGGLDLLRQIRADARTQHLQVIVVTASESPDELAECRKLGVSIYVTKPFSYPEVASALGTTLRLTDDPRATAN